MKVIPTALVALLVVAMAGGGYAQPIPATRPAAAGGMVRRGLFDLFRNAGKTIVHDVEEVGKPSSPLRFPDDYVELEPSSPEPSTLWSASEQRDWDSLRHDSPWEDEWFIRKSLTEQLKNRVIQLRHEIQVKESWKGKVPQSMLDDELFRLRVEELAVERELERRAELEQRS